ncbi:MAG: metal-dependent hydrolase [Promethearchaeia archaeon]
MTSFISHAGIGLLCGELILRTISDKNHFRKEKRPLFWWAGSLGGLLPDLDVIPAIITSEHYYAYHHIYTHTFLALGFIALILIASKFNSFFLAFSVGYGVHLFTDFIDNSISPLGPFVPEIQWGLIAGWSKIPGGGWESEFWLQPGYTFDNDLWSIFMKNGWGMDFGIEFLTYYDIAIMMISIPLIVGMIYLTIKKFFPYKRNSS